MMQLNMLVQATKFFGFAWTRAKQARFTCSPKHMACYTNHTGLCRTTTAAAHIPEEGDRLSVWPNGIWVRKLTCCQLPPLHKSQAKLMLSEFHEHISELWKKNRKTSARNPPASRQSTQQNIGTFLKALWHSEKQRLLNVLILSFVSEECLVTNTKVTIYFHTQFV